MKKLIIITIFIIALFGEDGAVIYNSKGCYGCHGPTAMGGGSYPQLAGKDKEYLLNRLKKYRTGKMKTSGAFLMAPFANALSPKEMETITEYLSKLSEDNKDYYDPGIDGSDAYGGGGS